MHELSLAEDLAERCCTEAHGRRVLEIWARCPESIDQAELQECFDFVVGRFVMAGKTNLAGAALALQGQPMVLECQCGYGGHLDADHVAGHISICPICGRVGEVPGSVELVGLIYDGTEPLDLS